jgi:hypothetical protein
MPDRGINLPACQAELSIYPYISVFGKYVKRHFRFLAAAFSFFGNLGNFYHIFSDLPSVTPFSLSRLFYQLIAILFRY